MQKGKGRMGSQKHGKSGNVHNGAKHAFCRNINEGANEIAEQKKKRLNPPFGSIQELMRSNHKEK